MNIVLQRIGVSLSVRTNLGTLLTPGVGTEEYPGFYAEISNCQGQGFRVDLKWQDKYYSLPEQVTPNYLRLFNMVDARKALAERASELLGEPVTVDDRTEMYMPHSAHDATMYPHIVGDVEFKRARYEEGTNTVRSVPENYCLIWWNPNGQPQYDCDGATAPEYEKRLGVDPRCYWRKICAAAHQQYLMDVNQRKGSRDAKVWLAWLVSEWRKYGINS